jgi:tetratricopeptide (TPR) repeat protein
MEAVFEIPAVVSVADRDFAAKLCARLRAYVLLQGEVRQEAQGAWSVYAATCHRGSSIRHIDPHTRDETPVRVRWKWAFENLTGVPNVPQAEYPLEFAHELRAVVQGTAGLVAGYLGDPGRAVVLLAQAIAIAPKSSSPQIDLLRLAQAQALVASNRRSEGLRLLRSRFQDGDASPELLRAFAYLLVEPTIETDEEEAREAIDALRAAAKDRVDPRRDQTLYNLSQQLVASPIEAERDEAKSLMYELVDSDSHYPDAWYFKRALGAIAWEQYVKEFQAGIQNEESAAEAARWYSAAIRARPWIRFMHRRPGRPTEVIAHFIVPPVMFANAKDGHAAAGHRIRAAWYEHRFQRRRGRLLKKGERLLRKGKWNMAIPSLDWASSAGRRDPADAKALMLLGIALKEAGRPIEVAGRLVQRAAEIDQDTAVFTAGMATASFPLGQPDRS